MAFSGDQLSAVLSRNLIEYNDISHTLDFVDTNGGYNIIRNNYAPSGFIVGGPWWLS